MAIQTKENGNTYHGILLMVDKSGINLNSPVPVSIVSAAGQSAKEVDPIAAKVKPTPFFLITLWKRFEGTACRSGIMKIATSTWHIRKLSQWINHVRWKSLRPNF